MHRQQVPSSNKKLQKCTALKVVLIVPFMIFPLPQLLLLPAKGTAILHKAEETPEIITQPGKHSRGEGAHLSKQHPFIYANC